MIVLQKESNPLLANDQIYIKGYNSIMFREDTEKGRISELVLTLLYIIF